jgi:c-di-GMP-binding flagellar brake protein YcgR
VATTTKSDRTAQAGAANGAAIISGYITDADEARRIFTLFRDQRSDLSLRFEGESQAFAGHVLDVDDTSFLLGNIRPRSGQSLLSGDEPFSLTGRSDGIFVHAEALRTVDARTEGAVPYYRVPLPERLLYQQRRRAARFRVPLRVATHGAEVRLLRSDEQPISAAIVDISVGGCRCVFEGSVHPVLEVDEQIPGCRINVPKLLNLEAEGLVRHVTYDQDNNHTSCGIEFVDMDAPDRRKLEQFVQTLATAAKVAKR